MITENVKDNESFESAYKRFKRKCEKEQIFEEYKIHERYMKPSQKKREAVKSRRGEM